ncbi:MAG TPA: hypothetical protein VH253_09170 [Phycisphaerae bacterium]|nr:hypothetical protein [Phycisphaerae bacterium]
MRFYDRLRLLSVDVALAALGGGVMAARVVGVTMPRTFYLLLPLSVWVVYTLDHLLDARRMGAAAHTPRHRFHFRYRAFLWPACTAGAVLCALLAFWGLSWLGLAFGAGMCGLVLLHLLLVKAAGSLASPLLAKELGVGVIFTAGVWGLPLLRHGWARGADWPLAILIQYFLLAMVNLLTFSLAEAHADAADHQTSFVLGVGPRAATAVTWAILAATIALGIGVAIAWPTPVPLVSEGVFAAMSFMLASILLWPRWMHAHERYRAIGDGAFLLPLLLALV